MGRGEGGEWYLSKGGGGGEPHCPNNRSRSVLRWGGDHRFRGPHIIVLDYTRRIDQIQSTMDKSCFGTSMLAYDNVRGHLANTSLIQSPRGHTTGSGNAQHYMLACVLLIIAGRNCVRIW